VVSYAKAAIQERIWHHNKGGARVHALLTIFNVLGNCGPESRLSSSASSASRIIAPAHRRKATVNLGSNLTVTGALRFTGSAIFSLDSK
jgi:hypothetical protein